MFSATIMFRFAVAAFRSVGATVSNVLEFEYQRKLCDIFAKMLQNERVLPTLSGRSNFEIKCNPEAASDTSRFATGHSLPPAVRFMHEHKPEPAPCSTPIQGLPGKPFDADMIVRGAIDALNALVAGVDQDWLETSEVFTSTQPGSFKARVGAMKALSAPKMTRSFAKFDFATRDGPAAPKKSASTAAPRMTRSYAQYTAPAPTQSAIRRKETFETSEHNKNRMRATLARTKSLYVPGSCVRQSGQLPGSQTRTAIHGSDGALNVALYPKAMLVKLKTFEGDDMVDSGICDPEETVRGAIERLNALVDGLGYKWVDEGVRTGAPRIQRGGSTESVDSNATASSGPHPTTPRDELCFAEVFEKN